MKRFTVFIYTLVTLALIAYGINLTFNNMTGRNLKNEVETRLLPKEVTTQETLSISKCSSKEKLDLSQVKDPHLAALADLQEICDSFVTDRLMIFTRMPNSKKKAQEMATGMSNVLKEFSSVGVTPIVIVEPDSDWGLVDFSEFRDGFWDVWIREYFISLTNAGITQNQMGIWVPFPEANIPTWNKQSSAADDFALAVNRYTNTLKTYYPETHVSILLNSATYDIADYDWAYGEFISLNPYLRRIEPGKISSFGLQGFPWLPRKTSQSTTDLTDPSEYLNYLLPVEAARTLKIKEVWFNTGTFASKYTSDPANTIYMEGMDRLSILEKTIEEAQKIQERDMVIWINIFAEDKSETPEGTNWSYTERQQNSELNQKVFKGFLRKANEANIKVSLFVRKGTPEQAL